MKKEKKKKKNQHHISAVDFKLLCKRLSINNSILDGKLKDRKVVRLVQYRSKANGRTRNRVPVP